MNPSGHAPSSRAAYRPRFDDGMNSARIAAATGNSAPIPIPSTNRKASIDSYDQANERPTLASPQITMLYLKTRRRPNRSASAPAPMAPKNIPAKLALPSTPVCAGLRSKWSLMGESKKVIAPRSMESKNHAVAMTRNRFRCTGDQGSRSRRPATSAGVRVVGAVVEAASGGFVNGFRSLSTDGDGAAAHRR